YCFTLEGGMISWSSVKQKTVATLTAEAEYMALCEAAKEAVWLKKLLLTLNHPITQPIVINDDNQAAISLSSNAVHHAKTKHIDIRYHYTRDLVKAGEIHL